MFESRKPWAQAAALVVIFWKSNGTIQKMVDSHFGDIGDTTYCHFQIYLHAANTLEKEIDRETIRLANIHEQ
jgi:hypothetical protein